MSPLGVRRAKAAFFSGCKSHPATVAPAGSNPIVEIVLAELSLTDEQKIVVREALDDMVSKRSGRSGPAVLTNPINIGIGTK